MKTQQNGFTLIELVIVIVVLGILAATALPRFLDLGKDARIAKLNGALASVKSAASLAHAASLARGAAPSEPVEMEGISVAMLNRYPTAGLPGIFTAAQLTSADGFIHSGGGTGTAGETITILLADAPTPANCSFTYTNPATLGDAPTYGGPVTTGC